MTDRGTPGALSRDKRSSRRACAAHIEGGGKGNIPLGQVFHASSFTRPTVVSGSKAIDLRRPETSKNCTSVWGTCGTRGTGGTASSSRSASGGGTRAPLLPSLGTASSSRSSLLPAAELGRVLSTRVNDVRVLAGSAVISTGTDLENVGRDVLRCGGAG